MAVYYSPISEARDGDSMWRRAVMRDSAIVPVVQALIFAAIAAPRLIPALLPALCAIVFLQRRGIRFDAARTRSFGHVASAFAVGFGLFVLFVLSRVAAAPDVARAVGLVSFCAATLALTMKTMSALPELRPSDVSETTRAVMAATLAGAIYLLAEFLTSRALVTAALQQIPLLAGGNKVHFVIRDNEIEAVRSYVMDRNVGFLNLILWPVLLMAAKRVKDWRRLRQTWFLHALFLTTLLATFLSVHKTSKIALVVATLMFMLARMARRSAFAVVSAAWIVACLLVVPAAHVAYDAGLQNSEFLAGSARARIVLWNFGAKQVPENWWFGKGIDSVRYNDELQGPTAYRIPGELADQRNGRHSHNVYLQIWYELGAIGAVLFMIAGLFVLRRISKFERSAVPFALATFTSAMTIAAFSWGLWQHWYSAAVCLASLLLMLAARPPTCGWRGSSSRAGVRERQVLYFGI